MSKEELQTAIDYVTDDSGIFDTQKFTHMWPSDPGDQRMIVGLLTAKSYREMQRQSKTNHLQWGFIVVALLLGMIGTAHVIGLSQFSSILAGVALSAVAQGLRMILTN